MYDALISSCVLFGTNASCVVLMARERQFQQYIATESSLTPAALLTNFVGAAALFSRGDAEFHRSPRPGEEHAKWDQR